MAFVQYTAVPAVSFHLKVIQLSLGKTGAINPEVFKTPVLIATYKTALLQVTMILKK